MPAEQRSGAQVLDKLRYRKLRNSAQEPICNHLQSPTRGSAAIGRESKFFFFGLTDGSPTHRHLFARWVHCGTDGILY